MTAPELTDDHDVRKILGPQLRSHVAYQSGERSLAPSVIFADADYEASDGTCGLWPDGKQANEPAIVYARFDAVLHLTDRVAELEAENKRLREALAPFAGFVDKDGEVITLKWGASTYSNCLAPNDFYRARAAFKEGGE